MGKRKRASHDFRSWMDSFPEVSSWMERHGDLEAALDANGGLVKLQHFLPPFVAEGILEALEQLPDSTWNMTSAQKDYTHNNIDHEFWSVKGAKELQAAFRVLSLLLPEALHTFSAAKYCRQHHISPHDDRAYTQVKMDDGSIITCSRTIGVIYYLTQGWSAEEGGHLVDMEDPAGPQHYVPEFNSAICFRVPRYHSVTPVTSSRPRYSLFGWFLEPGLKYELYTGEQQQQQQREVAATGGNQAAHSSGQLLMRRKKKKKKKKHLETLQQQQQQQASPAPGHKPAPDGSSQLPRGSKKKMKRSAQHQLYQQGQGEEPAVAVVGSGMPRKQRKMEQQQQQQQQQQYPHKQQQHVPELAGSSKQLKKKKRKKQGALMLE